MLPYIIWDNIDTSSLFTTEEVTYSLLSKDVQTQTVGTQDGVQIKSVRLNSNEFKAKIFMDYHQLINAGVTSEFELKREIASIFNTDEPKQFIWSKDPNIYVNAIYKDQSEITFYADGTMEAELNFLVPDGVAHAVAPTVSDNFIDGQNNENLVLDSEFKNLDKYWMPFTYREDEKYENSAILTATFDETTDTLHKGQWQYMAVSNINRRRLEVKKGDIVSAGCWVRINDFNDNDTNGNNSFNVTIEEFETQGKARIAFSSFPVFAYKVGEWVYLRAENYKIQNAKTKYVLMQPFIKGSTSVSISQPMFNLGPKVLPYQASSKNLSEIIKVYNYGTYKSYPHLTATLNGESGVLAFINSNGSVLQFGNPEELDGKEGKRSDKIVNYSFYGKNPKTQLTVNNGGATQYPNYLSNSKTPNIVEGSVYYTRSVNTMDPVFPNNSKKVWHGPRVWMNLDKNYNNENTGDFQWVNRLDFSTKDNKKQVGRIEFYLYDENNKAVMGGVIRDSNETKQELIVEYHGPEGKVESHSLNLKKFPGKWFEFKFQRKGAHYYWQFAQVKSAVEDKAKLSVTDKFDLNLADVGDVQICGMSVWFEKLGNKPVARESWNHTKFEWLNEETWSNIPNLFDDGDKVEVDVAANKLYINDVEENGAAFHAIDNQWDAFCIDKPNHEIQVVTSEWANLPEASIEFNESYV